MRSYGHYCGLAKALDVVGDRWTLLIVRELLLLGPARYTDLQKGLPGVATNLLAARLRDLEEAGLLTREETVEPAPATRFKLTPGGEALEPVIAALGRWAGPLMTECGDHDQFRSHWLALPVRLYLTDRRPHGRPIVIEVRTGDQPMLIESVDGGLRARPGSADDADLVLTGAPDLVMSVLTGRLSVARARARGLRTRGNLGVLRRVGLRPPDVPSQQIVAADRPRIRTHV